ncbi:MAG: aminotransferase class V-fold PLP-dependent enzyme, partial [Burkholderiaceae bacterium]
GGSAAKGARLAWLRNYWVQRVADLPGLRLMSPLVGDTALAAFTIDGMTAREVHRALLERFGIFTVERHVGETSVVRVTVALTTTTGELDRLVDALRVLAREAAGRSA